MRVRTGLLSIAALAVTTFGCSDQLDSEQPLNQNISGLAWSKCIFELDKVEAMRGRNLDDFDIGITSARNQFMVDCMTALDVPITSRQTLEMSEYAAAKDKRKPGNMTLNSANRSLPEDPAEAVKAQ